MKEAKARNPDIILWGLPWAFPGWLDATNSNNPYSNVSATAEYVVDWVDGARREHGLHIGPSCMFLRVLKNPCPRVEPSHWRAPPRLPLPRSHCHATTADRTATPALLV